MIRSAAGSTCTACYFAVCVALCYLHSVHHLLLGVKHQLDTAMRTPAQFLYDQVLVYKDISLEKQENEEAQQGKDDTASVAVQLAMVLDTLLLKVISLLMLLFRGGPAGSAAVAVGVIDQPQPKTTDAHCAMNMPAWTLPQLAPCSQHITGHFMCKPWPGHLRVSAYAADALFCHQLHSTRHWPVCHRF